MNTRMIFAALAIAVLLGAVRSTHASTFTIDTTPHNTTIAQFGYPNTATYGQTITVAAGTTQLDSFTFGIAATGGQITYRAYVMAWDGAKAFGPILFESVDQTTTGASVTYYTYNTGGINLIAGQQYVIFASVSNNYVAGNGSGVFAARNDAPYSGGQFVYMNNSSNFGQLSSDPWATFGPGWDLAFRAEFSTPGTPTPEPTSILLLGSGAAGLLAKYKRRRRSSAKL